MTALVLAAVAAGCGAQASSDDRRDRPRRRSRPAGEHDGVAAFDDDAVICGDGTSVEERGERAVAACRGTAA